MMTSIKRSILLGIYSCFLCSSLSAFAESPKIKIGDIQTNEDTSVIIKKGSSSSLGPEFEIVSGTGEILGDPTLGAKDAYSNWKSACDDWKKETRELNKENQVLALSCNAPDRSQENGQHMYRSTGTYKLKVRIRDTIR